MITRNVLGKIEPRIGDYFIEKDLSGKYVIMKDYIHACSAGKATLADPVMMWCDIEPFDSLVRAYAWLKENVKNLL